MVEPGLAETLTFKLSANSAASDAVVEPEGFQSAVTK
jgi:hypothetical protein